MVSMRNILMVSAQNSYIEFRICAELPSKYVVGSKTRESTADRYRAPVSDVPAAVLRGQLRDQPLDGPQPTGRRRAGDDPVDGTRRHLPRAGAHRGGDRS